MTDPPDLGRSGLSGISLSGPRQTATEAAYGALRRAILNGELESGTRLVQQELATLLGVSTTPVREALRELASEGLIRFDSHRGAVVVELSDQEVREIYAIRELLEPVVMRLAVPKLTDEVIERLRKLHDVMVNEPQSADWVDANRSFHMAIYEAGGSPRLASIVSGLEDSSVMYIGASLKEVPGLREDAIHDHAELLEALERRDADRAVEVVLRHLSLALRAFKTKSPDASEGGGS